MLPELFLAILSLAAPDTEPPTLFVSRIEGRVTADRAGGGVATVQPRQVLPGAWRLIFPPQSGLAGVCSNDRRLRIGPPTTRAVVGEACSGGRIVLTGTYRALVHGRLELATESVHRTNVRILSNPIRGSDEDDPVVPTLLDPRETVVLEARPPIRWTRVHGAVEYELEVVGGAAWRRTLEADDVSCAVEEHLPGRLDVCSIPWPESEPDLRPGEPTYLEIGARTGRVTPLRAGEARSVTRATEATADAVLESLDALGEADLTPLDRAIRSALLLAGEGLIGDACRTLREALAEHPTADGFLLLGALDLDRELPRAATRSFEAALERADPTTPDGASIVRRAREGLEAARRALGPSPRSESP